MTVYIDVLIVMNIYISYFTLRAASRLLHTDLSLPRLAGAAVFGGFSALASAADVGPFISLLIKAALTAVMVLIAFGFGNLRRLMLRSFTAVTIGMLICGAASLIHEYTGSDLIFNANGYVYVGVSALVLVISSAVIYGILSLFRRISDRPAANERVPLTVTVSGNTAVLSAIPDSGNGLRDFLTGRPVIICKKSAAENILPPNVRSYLSGCTEDMTGIRLIPMRTASGEGIAAAFRPDSLTAEIHGTKKRLDALIAVYGNAIEDEDFDAIMSPKLLQ